MAPPQVPWADRTWVPPLVVHLLWISIAIILAVSGSLLLAVVQEGGFVIAGTRITPYPMEVALFGVFVQPLILPLWLPALVILSKSTLWPMRDKLMAAWLPLLCGVVLGLFPAAAMASQGSSGMGLGAAISLVSILGLSGWALVRTWLTGTRAARRRLGHND